MKAEDLKTKTFDELKKTLMDLRKQQFNLRFQRIQGQLEKTSQVRAVRRDIARVKTFMSQQVTGAAKPEPKAKAKPVAKKAAAPKKAAPKKTATKAKKPAADKA